MKKTILLLSFLVILSACKTDDSILYERYPDENGFWLNNNRSKLYETDFAIKVGLAEDINFTISNTKNFLVDLIEGVNVVTFTFESNNRKIKSGTYTFLEINSTNFDSSKNFHEAKVGINSTATDNKRNFFHSNLVSGTIKVENNDTSVSFYYDLKFENNTHITGKYEGLILKLLGS